MRKTGALQVEVEMQIPFFDVDMMEIAWHGHYVKYLEVARCALLDRLDHNYLQMRDSGYGWPVIDLQIRYIRPLLFQQRVRVKADLVEWENRLKLNYLITDTATGERLTRASTVQVAVDLTSREMQLASPRVFTDAVERALACAR